MMFWKIIRRGGDIKALLIALYDAFKCADIDEDDVIDKEDVMGWFGDDKMALAVAEVFRKFKKLIGLVKK